MTTKYSLGLIVLALAHYLGACSDDGGGGGAKEQPGEVLGLACPTDSTVTYDTDIKPFMTKYCIGCHGSTVPPAQRQGAPSDHNFDSEQGILAEAQHVAEAAAAGPDGVNTAMPQGTGPKPTPAEREVLGEWLACKAGLAGQN